MADLLWLYAQRVSNGGSALPQPAVTEAPTASIRNQLVLAMARAAWRNDGSASSVVNTIGDFSATFAASDIRCDEMGGAAGRNCGPAPTRWRRVVVGATECDMTPRFAGVGVGTFHVSNGATRALIHISRVARRSHTIHDDRGLRRPRWPRSFSRKTSLLIIAASAIGAGAAIGRHLHHLLETIRRYRG